MPAADHQFLLEHDPALYARSISMRLPKDDPYEYEQFSEEDKQQTDIVASVERLNLPIKGAPLSDWLSNAVLDIKV